MACYILKTKIRDASAASVMAQSDGYTKTFLLLICKGYICSDDKTPHNEDSAESY